MHSTHTHTEKQEDIKESFMLALYLCHSRIDHMRKGNAHRLTLYVLPSFGGRHYIAVVETLGAFRIIKKLYVLFQR